LKPFSSIALKGKNIDVNFEYSDKHSVKLNYLYNPDISKIKTSVQKVVLVVDSQQFANNRDCNMLCLFTHYNVILTIYSTNYTANYYPTKDKSPYLIRPWRAATKRLAIQYN